MKQKLKFFVGVFGITLAISGSYKASAAKSDLDSTNTIRCSGTTGGCAKVEGGGWLVGTRSQTLDNGFE